mmetsp:Transcript_15213/g.31092  ORF Transcript_15213/g.31092 Transcript_15213/m.31092 type:complete len:203 (-) Transcript_15213:201-809(-)|eukprot:CAMPEP_0183294710 /NCGR_PEP_ID=MMETSP0160_2-20130417/2935_1 /TAXON_ID=2839 ORGANISM="Odontella Sinensis, Strain Grunow 1884" /NCGR_SAMPLE_ID=MMETSP0160_2 /ASSEMBLY_ACC=CAM_ASM_000250 /LENGTH=202 /DNA_ID=CAMNT_0025456069 /DNA_START=75 /DNA_END=683 /DNA_ORIENTATION=+
MSKQRGKQGWLDQEEPMIFHDESRSIFRQMEEDQFMSPKVMRANPVTFGVSILMKSHGNIGREDPFDIGDADNGISECPSKEMTEEGSKEDADTDCLVDFDWTENADYEPTKDLNPVLYQNSSQYESNSPEQQRETDFSVFFNTTSHPSLINIGAQTKKFGSFHEGGYRCCEEIEDCGGVCVAQIVSKSHQPQFCAEGYGNR